MLYWRSLRSKLLTVFLTLLLLPLLGLGLYGHDFLSRTLENQAITDEQQRLLAHSLQMQGSFALLQNDLLYLSELHAINTLRNLPPDFETIAEARQALRRDILIFASSHPMYSSVTFVDNSGQQVVGLSADVETRQLDDFSLDEHAAQLLTGALASPVGAIHIALIADSATSDNALYALRFDEGVMAVELRSAWLFGLIPGTESSETWSLRLPTGEALHYTSGNPGSAAPRLSQEDIWQNDPSGYYDDGSDMVFYQHMSALDTGENSGWVLFHRIPRSLLYSDLSRYYETYALLAFGAFLCVIALALFAIDRFVEPLDQLKQSVNTMRRTARTPELPGTLPPDEIGDLTLAFYSMAMDLGEKRRSERALLEKLITAQEEERKRIAYDLHDGLLQQLIGARLYLNKCRQQIAEPDQGAPLESFDMGFALLSKAVSEGRHMIEGLHPTILDDLGLVEAIAELSQSFANISGWEVELALEPLSSEPDKVTSVTIYRIAQEALNNISKHAQAQRVQVRLSNHNGLLLNITDDGQGFDVESPPESNEGGWGIHTMRERTKLLDGTIEIRSHAAQGTTVHVWVPFETADTGENDR